MTRKASTKAPPVPTFASVEEEAVYWDTHSLADHWESATPVRLRVAKK